MVYITHPVLGSSACETQKSFCLEFDQYIFKETIPQVKSLGISTERRKDDSIRSSESASKWCERLVLNVFKSLRSVSYRTGLSTYHWTLAMICLQSHIYITARPYIFQAKRCGFRNQIFWESTSGNSMDMYNYFSSDPKSLQKSSSLTPWLLSAGTPAACHNHFVRISPFRNKLSRPILSLFCTCNSYQN